MRNDGQLGHKLGPKLVDLAVAATIATRRALAPHEARVTAAALQQVIDRAGHEVGDLYRPLVAEALASGKMHPKVHAAVEAATSGTHQWQALIGLSGLGGAISSPIGAAIGAAAAPFLQETMRAFPYLIPPPDQLAVMTVKGIIGEGFAADQAKAQGYDTQWFDRMVQLARQMPDAASVFDLANRGIITSDMIDYVFRLSGIPPELAGPLKQLRFTVLSPADCALAVLRGTMTHALGARTALSSGVTADDFRVLMDNTGEPLGLDQLLEANRRGFIDTERLKTGILQSRVRDEWIPTAVQLAYSPMSTADAIDAVVQGHLSEADAARIAHQNGLEPSAFAPMLETAGEPLSRTEMEDLLNRGEVTQAQVTQALKESRLKPKYTDLAVKLHVRLPPERTVVSMITKGVVTRDQGLKLLMDLGYTAQVAGWLYAEGTATKSAGTHHIARGQVVTLYEGGAIDGKTATAWLIQLGDSDADAGWQLQIADLTHEMRLHAQAVAVVRARYVARHITATQAAAALDDLDVSSAAKTRYLALWAIEAQLVTRTLTEAQVVKAQKLDLWGDTDTVTGISPTALARLTAMGYTTDDALLLAQGA